MTQPKTAAGTFAAPEQLDLDTVRSALRDAEQELRNLEILAPTAALRITLNKAKEGDQETVDRLAAIRQRVDQLRLALAAAEQAEADRRNARLLQDDAARRRAVSQHLSRMQKAGDKASGAIDAAISAFGDLIEAARSALAAMPPDAKRDGYFASAFGPVRLGRLLIVEMARICEAKGIEHPLGHMPFLNDLKRGPNIVPLRELLSIGVARVKADLAQGAAVAAERYGNSAGNQGPADEGALDLGNSEAPGPGDSKLGATPSSNPEIEREIAAETAAMSKRRAA